MVIKNPKRPIVVVEVQRETTYEVSFETSLVLSVNGSPTNGHIPTRTGDPHDVNVVL